MWYTVLVLLPGVLCQYFYTDNDGYLRSSSTWSISVTGAPWLIESRSYPLAAPRLKQSWGFVVSTPEGMTGALKISCNDLRMPETKSCRNFSLTIRDGTKDTRVCGDKKDYTFTSRNSNVTIEVVAEEEGKLYVSCVAKGILLDENKKEMVGATAVPPPTSKPPPSYLKAMSDEVDSSEAGVRPGAKATSCKCGWANKKQGRIVNGVEAGVNEFPFMVLMITRQWKQPSCGGTIISPLHVLTAAHCTQKHTLANTPLAVVVGLHDIWNWSKSKGTETYNVQRSIEHELYNNVTLIYDISLMFLEQSIRFSPTVGPACMPTTKLHIAGQYVKTIGWGAIKHKGFMTQELRKANVKVIPLSDCYRYASSNIDISRNPHQMCVFSHNRGFCMGDSGGPVVWLDPETNRYTLVGAPSFVIVCGSTFPSVAVDVSSFLPWIKQKMRETSRSAKTCSKI